MYIIMFLIYVNKCNHSESETKEGTNGTMSVHECIINVKNKSFVLQMWQTLSYIVTNILFRKMSKLVTRSHCLHLTQRDCESLSNSAVTTRSMLSPSYHTCLVADICYIQTIVYKRMVMRAWDSLSREHAFESRKL